MVEPDEDPGVAVRREALEELGCEVELLGIRGAFGGPEFRVHYQNGDEVSYVTIAYDVSMSDRTSPRADGAEILDAQFVARADLPKFNVPTWVEIVLAQHAR
jgi:8-oxo-dGTP pyrophosphatase MutT (NUDIX family)